MILERFNTVVFIGDKVTQSIYTAFNVLIREDLALGGLQRSKMSEVNQTACKCDNQFLNGDCLKYGIKSSEYDKENQMRDQKAVDIFCHRKSLISANL